ncbi:MAG TPA: hypothetical protein DGQ94_13350 [Pseudomonas sp.]|nr:hypothetical protein [Pseudomonas sp.]
MAGIAQGCLICRSGLVSRKGCVAAPAISAAPLKSWGCFAALSRHKAAPTGDHGRDPQSPSAVPSARQ